MNQMLTSRSSLSNFKSINYRDSQRQNSSSPSSLLLKYKKLNQTGLIIYQQNRKKGPAVKAQSKDRDQILYQSQRPPLATLKQREQHLNHDHSNTFNNGVGGSYFNSAAFQPQQTEPNSRNPSIFNTFTMKKIIESTDAQVKKPQEREKVEQTKKTARQLSSYLFLKKTNVLKQDEENQSPKDTQNNKNAINTLTPQSTQNNLNNLVRKTKSQSQTFQNLADEGTITIANLRVESVLGQGSYATVKLYRDKTTQIKYAVKVYEKIKLQSDSQRMNNAKKEIAILKRINHPNLIKLHSISEDSKNYYLIMEYISSLSLQSYAKSKPKQQLCENECRHIFKQIIEAISYLHSNHIAHRDIKPDNILMLSNSNIKLIDLGFATTIEPHRKSQVYCGTPNYMSPEMVSKKIKKVPHFPQHSDIWSSGIVLYVLLCGELPFRGSHTRDLTRKIQQSTWKVPDDVKASLGCLRVLRGCLEKSIERRWNADKILQDEWINGRGI